MDLEHLHGSRGSDSSNIYDLEERSIGDLYDSLPLLYGYLQRYINTIIPLLIRISCFFKPFMVELHFSFHFNPGMYVLNWVYRYQTEHYYDPIAATSGIIETFVGVFGFLCVVTQTLARLNGPYTSPERKKSGADDDSIYMIPSLFHDEKKGGSVSGGGFGVGDSTVDKLKGKYNVHLPV
jgi:hypothetical protein